jgi:hypothetical protein
MGRRVVAVAAVGVATLLMLGAGARAQTYPPPTVSITVDPAQPVQGQKVTVVLTGCKPRTIALIGFDLVLVGTPVVGSDGVATTKVRVPRFARPGRHTVTGACLGTNGRAVVVSTRITVRPAAGGATAPVADDSTGTGGDGLAATVGGGTGGGTTGGGSTGAAGAEAVGGLPSLDGLAGPEVPADADEIYEAAAIAGTVDAAEPGATQAPSGAEATNAATTDSGPGTMGTLARVAFGVAALGGVPVALALSRGRTPPFFTGRFAAQQ